MSFEELKKEQLTDELIKQDIIHIFKDDGHTATNVILMGVSVFMTLLLSFLTPFAWLLLLIPVFLLLLWYVRRKKKLEEIQNGKFIVDSDELLYEKQDELRTEPTFYKGKWISYLQFSNNGRFELEGMYYTWSDRYKMSGTGICNTSLPKDTFYVVLYEKTRKIAMVYNRKFFEYNK